MFFLTLLLTFFAKIYIDNFKIYNPRYPLFCKGKYNHKPFAKTYIIIGLPFDPPPHEMGFGYMYWKEDGDTPIKVNKKKVFKRLTRLID
jgi:hypothetical protein